MINRQLTYIRDDYSMAAFWEVSHYHISKLSYEVLEL